MPFGLRNAGQTFQRMMDEVLANVPHTFIYLDDVLVASPTVKAHKTDLKRVMDRLKQHGLVISKEKCQFFKSKVEFLGQLVSQAGIQPLPARE